MPRRSRIIATMGPACDAPGVLAAMVEAGVDVFRVGLAHGVSEEHLARVRAARAAGAEVDRPVGVLVDLPGPKLRCAQFPDGGVILEEGAELVLAEDASRSDESRIGLEPGTVGALAADDPVALGDGALLLRVVAVGDDGAAAVVERGGRAQGRPGVTLPSARMTARSPTPNDLELLAPALREGVDFVAVSFVTTGAEVDAVRDVVDGRAMVVAKLETEEAVRNLDEVIAASDAIMVARGDLGVRLPIEDVPHVQKRVIHAAVAAGTPVITATQMLESMTHAVVPTRAEVSDVANAVLDGSDALMLSAETAIGADPVGAVATMARIATRAEAEIDYGAWGRGLGRLRRASDVPHRLALSDAIGHAAWQAADGVDAAAIVVCTRSGATARSVARFRPACPILAYTPDAHVVGQLAITWGVEARLTAEHHTAEEMVWVAVEDTAARGVAKPGDVVVVLAGAPDAADPLNDVMRMVRLR